MKIASVVIDVATRALTTPYDYLVEDAPHDPQKKEQGHGDHNDSSAQSLAPSVGSCVLVPFGGRTVTGYIVELREHNLQQDINPGRLKPITRVLSGPLFLPQAYELALWIAKEYGSPLISALKLFLPPGQATQLRESKKRGYVPLKDPVERGETWLALTNEDYHAAQIRKNAHRQREILASLAEGPVRVSDLLALVPGARPVITSLEKKGLVERYTKKRAVSSAKDVTLSSAVAQKPEHYTQGQQEALAVIRASRPGDVIVIDGVTGSGKTEVYLSAIEEVLAQGKNAIVLVPEISLTAQTMGRFTSRFGDQVAMLHSRMSDAERRLEWFRVKRGEARIVIGARSALFAPMSDIGIIVIDEEHEHSYKQEQAPRYHGRRVAERLAQLSGARLVLGSATPSLETLYYAEHMPSWHMVRIAERVGASKLPHIDIVDMRKRFTSSPDTQTVISEPLKEALINNYKLGNKTVLLLNRRGFATFLKCQECGAVLTCPHCSSSLTYHARERKLKCHTCSREYHYSVEHARCPNCGSIYMKQCGAGTERIEQELHAIVPDAPIVRMDSDTTQKRDAHQKLLESFDAQPAAILLGTQMIAKGLDFPEVTLVGVIDADTSLKFPDFRAPENTHNLLEQVAGRAGRGEQAGRVIIQTSWPQHQAITSVAMLQKDAYRASELVAREEYRYPPYTRIANIIVSSTKLERAQKVVQSIADALKLSTPYEILGPAECMRFRVKDRYRLHVLVKARPAEPLGKVLYEAILGVDTKYTSVSLDVDAYDML